MCRRQLFKNYKMNFNYTLKIFDHSCYFLWEWNQESEIWVQKIIIALKDGDNGKLYNLFMSWLFKKINGISPQILITAIPSQNRRHPEKLIETFIKNYSYGGEIVLKKNKTENQKNKSRSERLKTNFKVLKVNPYHLNIKNKNVAIFDDVLSTGGSFKGALKSLSLSGAQVEFIAVWAYRPPQG